jgi:hypothetical protein
MIGLAGLRTCSSSTSEGSQNQCSVCAETSTRLQCDSSKSTSVGISYKLLLF